MHNIFQSNDHLIGWRFVLFYEKQLLSSLLTSSSLKINGEKKVIVKVSKKFLNK